jgi:endogenous inhibitor of DNA gyrase (YacG/DUF329 family)
MSHPPKQKMVACPQCGKASVWTQANRFRPFCSERCKLIDLGQWASEGYRIPTAAQPEPEPDQSEGKD